MGLVTCSRVNLIKLLYYSLKNDDFVDETSKTVYNQIVKTNLSVCSRVMPNIVPKVRVQRYTLVLVN